jgi:hypothetical protein
MLFLSSMHKKNIILSQLVRQSNIRLKLGLILKAIKLLASLMDKTQIMRNKMQHDTTSAPTFTTNILKVTLC